VTKPPRPVRGPGFRGALALWACCAVFAFGAGCAEPRFEPPKPPPDDPNLPPVRLELPRPPKLERPSTPEEYGDGAVSVYGLRRQREKRLRSEVRVRAVVEQVYVCPWAEEDAKYDAAREKARRQGRPTPKREVEHPPCKRPHFIVADAPGARRKLLAVDYDPVALPEPAVGTEVILTGTFATDSAEGFMVTEGLLRLTAWQKDEEATPSAE